MIQRLSFFRSVLFTFSFAMALGLASVANAASPRITGISPVRGGPGTSVTITGQNFLGLIQVQVGQGRATVQAFNNSVIVILVPPDATTGPIAVATSGGQDVSAQTFQAAPRITKIYTISDIFGNPVLPVKGVPGQQITIEGFNFSDPAGTATYINDVQIPGAVSADTQILGTLVTTAQSGPIKVVTSAGTALSTEPVYFNPKITSFTAKAAAGDTITINGSSFLNTSSVLIGGVSATFTVKSNTNLQAVVPAAVVDGKITLTAPGGSFITTSNFSVLPAITGFTPAGGPVGTVVTISGTGLRNTSSVLFGSVPVTLATNLSSTQITAVVPAGAFTAPITVGTLNGSSSPTTVPFYVAPRIDSFDPQSGQPGTVVTLAGANFTGATAVLLGGTNIPGFTVTATNRITVTLPDGAPTGKWRVTTPGGSADSANNFTSVGRVPLISDFTPKVGSAGTVVTLVGSNLVSTIKVEFNGVNAAFTVSGTSVLATVPAGATTGLIRVTNPAGQATSTGNFSVGTSTDLRVTLTPGLNPPVAYSPLSFGIRVVNRGALPALNPKLVFTLPDGSTFDSASGVSDFDVIGRKVTMRPPTIEPNGSISATVRVRLGAPGTVSATLEATSDTPEATAADNTATTSQTSQFPLLSFEPITSSLITLQWPSAATSFVLETSPKVIPAAWNPATNAVTDDGTTRQIILEIPADPGASALFRLRLNTSQ
jgi:hypothetical protein